MGVFLFTNGISAAIGEAFVCKLVVTNVLDTLIDDTVSAALSTDPLLVWNYGTMAVLALIAGVLFWFIFQDLDAREDELNQIPAGGFET